MSATIIEYQTTVFESLRCYACDVQFYITKQMYEKRKEDGATFWCPNGHGQQFAENIQLKLSRAIQERDTFKNRLYAEADQRAAAEHRIEQLKARVGKGVCPCCKRSFTDLRRHMECKHPKYSK